MAGENISSKWDRKEEQKWRNKHGQTVEELQKMEISGHVLLRMNGFDPLKVAGESWGAPLGESEIGSLDTHLSDHSPSQSGAPGGRRRRSSCRTSVPRLAASVLLSVICRTSVIP